MYRARRFTAAASSPLRMMVPSAQPWTRRTRRRLAELGADGDEILCWRRLESGGDFPSCLRALRDSESAERVTPAELRGGGRTTAGLERSDLSESTG